MGSWQPSVITSLGRLQWLMLVFGAASLLERLIAAGIGFVSRKVWKCLPRSALMVKCVNAVTRSWCSISPRYKVLLSPLCCVGRHFRPCEAMGIWACMVNLELPSNKSQLLHVPFSYIDLAQGRFFQRKMSRNERNVWRWITARKLLKGNTLWLWGLNAELHLQITNYLSKTVPTLLFKRGLRLLSPLVTFLC